MILRVSASPHVRHQDSTASIMRDVCIALVPALFVACYFFGVRVLALTSVCVLSSVFFEYLSRLLMKRPQTISDWSAVVTGMLLAFNLPADFPYWMAVVGSFFAIVVAKQAFGGIGMNFVNPALTARVLMLISFPAEMTHYVIKGIFSNGLENGAAAAGFAPKNLFSSLDLVSQATPLHNALINMNPANEAVAMPTLFESFIGCKAGVIGEVSIAALLIGAIYLLVRKVIDFSIPVAYIGTVLIFTSLCGADPLVQLLNGGLILGAFFMAMDYVTSPVSRNGKIIFGIGCGLLTGLIRMYGSSSEGVSYSILLMNILTPHIERLTSKYPRKERKAALRLQEKEA